MIENKCEHSWKKHTNAGREFGAGSISASYLCEKCKTEMLASEVFQLEALENQNETLKHLKGFQKHIAIITVIISSIAIIVSIIALFVSINGNSPKKETVKSLIPVIPQ